MYNNSKVIPENFLARQITETERDGWLNWSLDYFSNHEIIEDPYWEMTLQLDVSDAYKLYQQSLIGGGFFLFWFGILCKP